MTYTPTDWTDGLTPVNAALMDKIEQGIDDVDSRLTIIETVPQGAELAYEGEHVPATEYEDGDVVVKDGIAYLCVGGPTTEAPTPVPWQAVGIPLLPPSPSYGTTLPASPVDGQEAILVDSLTVPAFQWRFRYNAQASGGFKWEFIGGAPRTLGPQGSGTQSAAETWIPMAGGPALIVPRTGEYHFSANVRAQCYAFTTAFDSNARFKGTIKGVMQQWYLMTHTATYTGGRALIEETQVLTAGETLSLEWKINLATQTAVDSAILSLTPLRVS